MKKFDSYFDTPAGEDEEISNSFRGKKGNTHIHHILPKDGKHYSKSFGYEWNNFEDTQIDRQNGTKATLKHLEMMLKKPIKTLLGKTILEVGSGAGRYTDYFVDYAKEVVTVDPSSAIYSNAALGAPNLLAVHGDLFDLSVKKGVFDIVYCRGVIQHTYNPQLAIWQLYSYVKEGGDVIFDVYAKSWRNFFYTYYYFRPFTKKLNRETFHNFLKRVIPPLLWFKMNILNRLFPNIRYIKDIPDIILPIFDYSRLMPGMTFKANVEWAILNCLDAYTPEYDTPLTWNEIMGVISHLPNHKVVFADQDMFRFRIQKLKR